MKKVIPKVSPVKKSLDTKLYYSISEVAELTDLQPYTLRAWEKEFACLRPRRARGKNRAYRTRDIAIIQLIKQLLYAEGYTTKGVKQKLKNEPDLLKTIALQPFDFAGGGSANSAASKKEEQPSNSSDGMLVETLTQSDGARVGAAHGEGASGEELRSALDEARRELREILRIL